ncbi:beta-ketoacyl synthase N-terminal-like domain-containing protein [Micromonospora sp. WMMD723]|uniref:beta-ketoacyl synthase N-terminal-like domain-containing protein n=1 Tax=Micromonospora sp. WMMD723 TaxID=3403465 RepID=UPI003CEC59CC
MQDSVSGPLRALRVYRPDDIAVVGVGCRFPGGIRSADGLWQALTDGADVIREVPPDRWDDSFHADDPTDPGTIYTRFGGFLEDIDRFDADFFHVSPREAAEIDPQQRILLEVAFEAMQDAGRPLPAWAGTRTGVFVGMLGGDYLLLHTKTAGHRAINPYFASGKEFSFAAGRIAYTFGLQGACMTVNTACSSSLAAVHLACQSLRDGSIDTALAGGVNTLLTPELSIFMSRVQAMSASGRCRPFDAAADGIVRGEGCAVVVLKRYADAVRDRDQIYGILLGSALNHNGHSAGLTVPSVPAQQELLRQALTAAGVDGTRAAYVEAHGTGTPLGDPLEVSALAEVMGRGRPDDRPLVIGSLKANFGHMDATAGVAGLLKTLLVLRHGVVPRQLHYRTPSPHIDWEHSGITVAAENLPVTADGQPLIGGTSAFGLSGTNVHVVVGAAPPAPALPDATSAPYTLLLSATTRRGLRETADDFADLLTDRPVEPVVATAAVRRTHHRHRLAVVGTTGEGLVAGLRAAARRQRHPAVRLGDPVADAPPVVFAYSGHGAQWPGMGMDLYETEPVFRTAFDECDTALSGHARWSVRDAVRDPDPAILRSTEIGQPALFALQVSLSRLWMSWGVRPDAVVGHSMGEIAAAHVAGALTLPDAARLVIVRSRTLQEASGSGRMASVDLPADELRPLLAERYPDLVVAAVNGPDAVVVSGPAEPLRAMVAELVERDVSAVELSVEYPSHGPLMQPYSERLRALLDDLTVTTPAVPLLSSTDAEDTGGRPDADYWARNLRQPVLFWPAVDRLLKEREPAFVEIGAHPVLGRAVRSALAHRDRVGPVVPSLVRGEDAATVLATSRAELHVAGVPVDWAARWPAPVAAVALPPERWAGSTYWLPGVARGEQGARTAEPTVAAAPVPPAGPPSAVRVGTTGRPELVATLQAALAEILGHPAGTSVGIHRGFFELGLDSVSALEFANRVQSAVGAVVDGADVLRCGTIDELAGHLLSSPVPVTPVTPAPPSTVVDPQRGTEPIAIIGLACRVPGGADADGFWALLDQHLDPSGEVPADRWDAGRLLADGTTTTARGSFLPAVDGFDHRFFRVSPREARSMDPQQRLFLEVAWEALEDAGLPADDLRDSATGVFVGLNTTDYQQLVLGADTELDLYYGTGTCFSGAAGRLSYLLGLRGPSIAVDTACSSSLTAVHLACQSLRTGECRVAVAGGANVMATSTVFRAMSAAGALSRDGRCKSFAEAADGYGRGEGAGAVILKPLSLALADGDRVHAVIRASAVNQDGASGGLTVPSGVAQQAVITDALRRADLGAAQLSYLEAHGTGTPLGDAVELRAIADVRRAGGATDQPLLVGSVKSNIGHLEAAAGVVGLIKVVLSLRHQRIPAQLHLDELTREIDWDASGLAPVRRTTAWRRGNRPRIAGVSAFGFTGTNAHLIVQEAPERASATAATSGPYLLAVSAASAAALDDARARHAEHLADSEEMDTADLAWTSLARRSHHEHRVAVVAGSVRELARALRSPRHAGIVPAGGSRRVLFAFGDDAPPWSELLDAAARLPGWGDRQIAALRAQVTDLRTAIRPVASPGGAVDGEPAAAVAAFVDQLSAALVWQSVGLVPQAVAGTGAGAYVAACVAGELSPEEALHRLTTDRAPADAAQPGQLRRLAAPADADDDDLVLDLGARTPRVRLAGTVVHRPPTDAVTVESLLGVVAALHVQGAPIRWDRLLPGGGRVTSLPAYPWQRTRHWVHGVTDGSAPAGRSGPAHVDAPTDGPSTAMSTVGALPASEREPWLVDLLLPVVAEVLGETDDIDPDRGFFDLGFDSVLSMKLKRRAEVVLGVELPNTVLFECPNTRALARFVVREVIPGEPAEPDDGDPLAELSDEALAARLAAAVSASAVVGGDQGPAR